MCNANLYIPVRTKINMKEPIPTKLANLIKFKKEIVGDLESMTSPIKEASKKAKPNKTATLNSE